MHTPLVLLYCGVLLVLCAYGVHRAKLVFECLHYKRRILVGERQVDLADADVPTVTVQLPLFNEATVAERLIEATGSLDYPEDRLEIQVLDDSTDETVGIARRAVDALRARGIDAVYVRRPS